MSDLERRIARLEALEAIRTCIFTYAAAGDRHNDPAVIERIFAEHGSYEAVGMVAAKGRDAVVRDLTAIGQDAVLFSFHHAGGPVIELAEGGLTARAFWWCWVPVRIAGGDEPDFIGFGAGHYNGDFELVDGEWKIARLKFEPKLRASAAGTWNEVEGDFEWLV